MISKYRSIIEPLIPAGLPYSFEHGKKHMLLRINGKLVTTISNRSKIEDGRAKQNIVSTVKRFVREIQVGSLRGERHENQSLRSGNGEHT